MLLLRCARPAAIREATVAARCLPLYLPSRVPGCLRMGTGPSSKPATSPVAMQSMPVPFKTPALCLGLGLWLVG